MQTLLDEVLEAHGGLDRWRQFSKVEADAVTGGGMFPLKGLMPDLDHFSTRARRDDVGADGIAFTVGGDFNIERRVRGFKHLFESERGA